MKATAQRESCHAEDFAQRQKEAKAEGLMTLALALTVEDGSGDPPAHAGELTVFVLPSATVAEVKRSAALTKEWKEEWRVG